LAEDQHGDSIYKNSSLNMDTLYRSGETQQVYSDFWSFASHLHW